MARFFGLNYYRKRPAYRSFAAHSGSRRVLNGRLAKIYHGNEWNPQRSWGNCGNCSVKTGTTLKRTNKEAVSLKRPPATDVRNVNLIP